VAPLGRWEENRCTCSYGWVSSVPGVTAAAPEAFIWYLLEYRIPAWPAAACKLCQASVPINTRYAHGREYLARQAEPH
jgi:hypothetical protein